MATKKTVTKAKAPVKKIETKKRQVAVISKKPLAKAIVKKVEAKKPIQKITEESQVLVLVEKKSTGPVRIQTAEGWKRMMLRLKKNEKRH